MMKLINFKTFLILFLTFAIYTMIVPLNLRALEITQNVNYVDTTLVDLDPSGSTGGWTSTTDTRFWYTTITSTASSSNTSIQYNILFNNILFTNVDWYEFSFMVSNTTADYFYDNINEYEEMCIKWTQYVDNNNNYYWGCSSVSPINDDNYVHNTFQTEMSDVMFQFYVIYNEGGYGACSVNNGKILCPTNRKQIVRVVINIAFRNPNVNLTRPNFNFFWGRIVNRYNNASSGSTDYTQQITVVQDKLDDVNSSINDVNSSINDLNDTLNSDTTPTDSEVDNKFGDFDDLLPSNNTISGLLSMPITLFQNVLNSINSTCSSFNLGSLFGSNLTLPCINISSYLGSNLWSIIDILFSGLFIFTISKKFIKVFENFSTLKEGDVIGD